MADDYRYWRDALRWRADPANTPMPDFDARKPEVGFYRGQRQEAVAIWRVASGVIAKVISWGKDGKASVATYDREDIIADNVFAFCCRHPIAHDVYNEAVRNGRWAEQITQAGIAANETRTNADESDTRGIGDNLPTSPEGSLEAELAERLEQANAFVRSIKAKVENQGDADKVANYGMAIADIEKRAEAAREAEKKPFLEGGRKVDAKWSSILVRASMAKANLKSMLTSWLSKKKRAQAERQEREEQERLDARSRGEPADLRRAEPSESVAGTQGGRISLRTRTLYEVSDLKALVTFLTSLNQPPTDFVEAARKSGEKLAKAGMVIPGLVIRSEEYSA
jgi:hypothetical protein